MLEKKKSQFRINEKGERTFTMFHESVFTSYYWVSVSGLETCTENVIRILETHRAGAGFKCQGTAQA